MVEAYPVRRYLIATDPWTIANRRRENPTVEDRARTAKEELQKRVDTASQTKPKTPAAKPYVPSPPPWKI